MSLINDFEIFLFGILSMMPVTKKISEIFIENIPIKKALSIYKLEYGHDISKLY